jgi:hypothetical protein
MSLLSVCRSSRLVALKALEAAARSDLLYQTANDFELQIEHLAPALVANCYPTPAHDLKRLYVPFRCHRDENDSLSQTAAL